MPESWELTEQERDALPAWARRGVTPHRPEVGRNGEMQCEECAQLWSDDGGVNDGCETVLLTRHLAQSEIRRGIAERRADAAERDAARLCLSAASLIEQRDALMAQLERAEDHAAVAERDAAALRGL